MAKIRFLLVKVRFNLVVKAYLMYENAIAIKTKSLFILYNKVYLKNFLI